MASDTRNLIDKDKWLPESLSGDGEKLLAVKADASGYEHITPSGGRLVGEIIMWPFDTPPTGFLSCRLDDSDDTEYETEDYAALGALLEAVLPGPSGSGYFQTPVILFPKNSGGTDTLDQEAEAVGTHGHTASAVAGHTHTVTVTSVANHTHSSQANGYESIKEGTGSTKFLADYGVVNTGAGGAHTHTASADSAGGHTPSINNHSGTNQPACTLLHFCIKT